MSVGVAFPSDALVGTSGTAPSAANPFVDAALSQSGTALSTSNKPIDSGSAGLSATAVSSTNKLVDAALTQSTTALSTSNKVIDAGSAGLSGTAVSGSNKLVDAALSLSGTALSTSNKPVDAAFADSNLIYVSAVVGAEGAVSANTIEIAVTLKKLAAQTAVASAKQVMVRSFAVTSDKGDLAAANTPVGTLKKVLNPSTGANLAWFETTAGGLFSVAVANDAVEDTLVEIIPEGGRPYLVKLTFA